MSKRPSSLEAFADKRAQARFIENQEIARENRAMRAAILEKDRELEGLQKRLNLLEKLDAARLRPPSWLAPKTSRAHVAIPTLLLTDIHWDEIVRAEQVEFYNCYTRAIAALRVRRAFEGAIVITRDYVKGLEYEGFNLMLGGDLISGIIHEELRETNEDTVMGSILSILDPLEAGINLLAREFRRVHLTAVVGNHGRNSKKPKAKNRARDNFDWLIYKLLQRDFAGRKDVTFTISEAADAIATVYRTRYLLTHGDQFQGGSGISGAAAPLLLGAHRKLRRQNAIGNPYDVMVMGHWHQTIDWPSKGLIVAGSVKGYDEYAYLSNLEPEEPQQPLWLTTPERGVTGTWPVFVQDRKAEGW